MLPEPEQLRRQAVAEDQRVPVAVVRADDAVAGHEALVGVGAVPGEEQLHDVAVEDDQAGRQHHLAHVLQVAVGDEVLPAEAHPQRDRQQSAPWRSRRRWRRPRSRGEDRGVPAGDDADREVEGDHGVHREHQRRREAGEQQVGRLVVVPVPRRAAPAERAHAVEQPRRPCSSPGRASSPGRGPGRRTRTAPTRWRRWRPRRRPRSAGCGTAARGSSCSGRGAASRRARAARGGAPGTCRRRPPRTASSPRRSG